MPWARGLPWPMLPCRRVLMRLSPEGGSAEVGAARAAGCREALAASSYGTLQATEVSHCPGHVMHSVFASPGSLGALSAAPPRACQTGDAKTAPPGRRPPGSPDSLSLPPLPMRITIPMTQQSRLPQGCSLLLSTWPWAFGSLSARILLPSSILIQVTGTKYGVGMLHLSFVLFQVAGPGFV